MFYDSEHSLWDVLHHNIQIYFIFLKCATENVSLQSKNIKGFSYLVSLREEGVAESDDVGVVELPHYL